MTDLPDATLCIALFNSDGSINDVVESWELALQGMEFEVSYSGAYATVLDIPTQRH